MRKRLKITTMDTQERYFRNSLGHASLPTTLSFLADPRALGPPRHSAQMGSVHRAHRDIAHKWARSIWPTETCQVRSGQVRSGQVRSGQVRSGSGQVCGFDYLLPTTYDLLPTTGYRLPINDYR